MLKFIWAYIRKQKMLKFIWAYIRKQKILKSHRSVADFWRRVFEKYDNGEIQKYDVSTKKLIPNKTIIWQYWGQGVKGSNMPELVSRCFASVDRFKGDCEIIRLDDNTINDYIQFPDFVCKRLKEDKGFNRTFFSDLLRLALLKEYGGVWIDATVYLTDTISKEYFDQPYFLYQRDDNEQNKHFWENSNAFYWGWNYQFKVRVLNSVFFAKNGNKLISRLLDLLLYYWEIKDSVTEYFFFQILYTEYFEFYKEEKCKLVSDVLPHLMQTKINGGEINQSYSDILRTTSIHKLTYFKGDALKTFLEKDVIIFEV